MLRIGTFQAKDHNQYDHISLLLRDWCQILLNWQWGNPQLPHAFQDMQRGRQSIQPWKPCLGPSLVIWTFEQVTWLLWHDLSSMLWKIHFGHVHLFGCSQCWWKSRGFQESPGHQLCKHQGNWNQMIKISFKKCWQFFRQRFIFIGNIVVLKSLNLS